MSAGKHGEYPGEPAITVISDMSSLAPGFARKVQAALDEMHAKGLDAIVHEAYRSHETALVYYARGRTTIPPHHTVTNAPNETYSYHGFGLAADIISKAKAWDAGDFWFQLMGAIAERHGLVWGGRWTHPDYPHIQARTSYATPSDHARELLKSGGLHAVWKSLGLDT